MYSPDGPPLQQTEQLQRGAVRPAPEQTAVDEVDIAATDVWWGYGMVESGTRTGRRGWVAGAQFATGYKHP
ncbi:hypothetical protein ACF08B_29920 [Streptomyces sp. NPDC015139]|uniref:hypothetical protein n=1 Tax=Streptomyces sp. NPDC015139 TaxID=3364942 RepID=UPI0036FDC7F2